ncbi:aspartic proteinase CDR1-like [Papaver somniferum]|uniref:aspartic proteinase CDR1-like n=1 Tax=Papaver somniferum TaxID=3469 RepID=UPI000E6FB2DB|nr:aspartic proteinase CDR1-like [Papaver somniferum]
MAAYNFSIVHLSVFFCYAISLVSSFYGGGFSVDLIHRDSPLSPFYSSTDKASDRAESAIRRSIERCSHFSKKKPSSEKSSNKLGNITSTVTQGVVGDYLMLLAVGTPALPLLAIADTGSDIIWFQCTPCDVCFPQTTSPIFAPENSSTYENIPCTTKECDALSSVSNVIPCDGSACKYNISYGDGSISIGNFARETLTFQSTEGTESAISVTNMAFGCGHNNTGIFSALEAASKLNFGSNPKLVDGSKVSTLIIFKENQSFYYLTLEAISVGDIRVPFNTSTSSSNEVLLESGNIIIDFGSTITAKTRIVWERTQL